jgi:hypothetical protein
MTDHDESDQDEFNPERARDFTINSVLLARETVKANLEELLPLVMTKLKAPSESHAKGAILLALDVLMVLAEEIKQSPTEHIRDGVPVLEAARAAAAKKTH